MQTSRLIAPEYASVNISEKYLRVFYRKSKSEEAVAKTNAARHRKLRKFVITTAEEVALFELLFEVVFTGYISRLKESHSSLSSTERTLIAFLRIGIAEKEIARNMGYTIEEVRRSLFSIGKKLHVSVPELGQFIHSI